MITNTQPTLFDAETGNSAKQLLADGAYNREVVDAALLLAFEAGKWAGQVELEEFIEERGMLRCHSRGIPMPVTLDRITIYRD